MKTKSSFKKVLGRFAFAAALMLCSVAFFASCSGGDDPQPQPVVNGLVYKNIELVNRVKANEAGKAKFTDATKVIGTLTTQTGDKTENKDVTKENTFTAEASWSAGAVTISTLTGELAKRPTISFANNGLTFDFGAFKAEKAVTIANSSFTFTESGKSFTVSDYGFNGGEVTADVVPATSTVQEGGKTYNVTTWPVKFKLKHKDGTATDEQTITFQKKDEVVKKTVVSYSEKKELRKTEAATQAGYVKETFVVTRKYNLGADSDTTFSVTYKPDIIFALNGTYIRTAGSVLEFDKVIRGGVFAAGQNQVVVPNYPKANLSHVVMHEGADIYVKGNSSWQAMIAIEWARFSYREGGLAAIELSDPTYSYEYVSMVKLASDPTRYVTITWKYNFGGVFVNDAAAVDVRYGLNQ